MKPKEYPSETFCKNTNIVTGVLENFERMNTRSGSLKSYLWFNSYLFRLRRIRNRLFSRSKLLHHEHRLSVAHRKLRNLYVGELRQAERRYYQLQMSALSTGPLLNDAHRWWKSAKATCGIQTCDTVPSLLHQGCMKTSAEDKADCLNSVFAVQCSAPPSTGKLWVSSTSVDIPESFSFTAIAQESVKKSLSKLNVWKAVGPDVIPNRVLKECAATLAEPLTFIFNCSLTSGLFPIQWKQGVIKPLFKNKGARSDPSCYRPVVLLPCVSRVFEGFVREQLQEHCMRIGVIPDEQYGFLPKRSTLWQILSVVDDW